MLIGGGQGHDEGLRLVRAVRVFLFPKEFAVSDNRLALFGGDVFVATRLVAGEIEGGKPITSFLGLALRPNLRRVALICVDKIHPFLGRRGVFKTN